MATSYLMSREFNNLDIKIVCINQQSVKSVQIRTRTKSIFGHFSGNGTLSLEKGCHVSNRHKQVIKRSKILMRLATFPN